MERFGYKNVDAGAAPVQGHAGHGRGRGRRQQKIMENALADMAKIAGQKPVIDAGAQVDRARSRSATAGRSAAQVTLRRKRMYEFLDRLVNVAAARARLPRRRRAFVRSAAASYNMGVKEQIIFPEIDF